MFETFNVPAMYVASQSVLPLYAAGQTTGIGLSSGHGVTYITPIHEGYALPEAVEKMGLAGSDITGYLTKLLTERGYDLSNHKQQEAVQDIKEKYAHVALNSELEMNTVAKSSLEKSYELPDGQQITIGSERFRCTEVMFEPSRLDVEGHGLPQLIRQAVSKINGDLQIPQSLMYRNIVISGGNTKFPGLAERIVQDLTPLIPSSMTVKVRVPQDQTQAAWVGGSILASLATFQGMWISKPEYDASGPAIVHRKCF